MGGWHSSSVAELLRLIERLEELHTKVQGMISPPHLTTTLLFNVSRRWGLYLNRCVAASALESLYAPGCHVSFLIEPILVDLEGGQYVGLILPTALGDLISMANGRGGGGGSGGDGSGGGATATKRKYSSTGGCEGTGALRLDPSLPVPSGRGEHSLHSGGDGPPDRARCSSLQELALVRVFLGGLQAERLTLHHPPRGSDNRFWAA